MSNRRFSHQIARQMDTVLGGSDPEGELSRACYLPLFPPSSVSLNPRFTDSFIHRNNISAQTPIVASTRSLSGCVLRPKRACAQLISGTQTTLVPAGFPLLAFPRPLIIQFAPSN